MIRNPVLSATMAKLPLIMICGTTFALGQITIFIKLVSVGSPRWAHQEVNQLFKDIADVIVRAMPERLMHGLTGVYIL